jgi:hypothetical protein
MRPWLSRAGAIVADLPTIEDRLAAQALILAADIRDDVALVHRTVRYLDRLELEQLCCVLAAMVDVNTPFDQMAWWRLQLVREAS